MKTDIIVVQTKDNSGAQLASPRTLSKHRLLRAAVRSRGKIALGLEGYLTTQVSANLYRWSNIRMAPGMDTGSIRMVIT